MLPSVSLSPLATRLDLPGDSHAASATAQIAPASPIHTLTGWRPEMLRARVGGPAVANLASGAVFEIEGGETVTVGPELARVTLSIATAHTDAIGISIARVHCDSRAAEARDDRGLGGCDRLGPVLEGDVLRTELRIELSSRRRAAAGGPAGVGVGASRRRWEASVLDGRFVTLVA